ncbi:MAG: hypothetical protein ACRELB_21730 [Polyangiaceae bacterium]
MLSHRSAAAVALLAAASIAVSACASVLGLDSGIPEADDASAEAAQVAATHDSALTPDPDRGDAPAESTVDAAGGTDAAGLVDSGSTDDQATADAGGPDAPLPEASPDASATPDSAPDAPGCLPPLQTCVVGSDCCSGVCGLSITCL